MECFYSVFLHNVEVFDSVKEPLKKPCIAEDKKKGMNKKEKWKERWKTDHKRDWLQYDNNNDNYCMFYIISKYATEDVKKEDPLSRALK